MNEINQGVNLSIRNKVWYIRLAHASKTYLGSAATKIDVLKELKFNESIMDCEVCKMVKIKRKIHKIIRQRYEKPL